LDFSLATITTGMNKGTKRIIGYSTLLISLYISSQLSVKLYRDPWLKRARTHARLAALWSTVSAFQQTFGRDITNFNELMAFDNRARRMTNDAWGHAFILQTFSTNISILSLGRDGKKGGTGLDADIGFSRYPAD